MKLFLINWGHREPLTADIAADLEKMGHEVLYWVRSNKHFSVDASKYPNTIIQEWNDAAVANPPKGIDLESLPVPSKKLLADFAAVELLAICMLDRDYPDLSASQKREMFHDHFRLWYGFMMLKRPDAIIMSDIPHRIVDFIIYSIAQYLNIPIILFGYTAISDRNYVMRDYEKGFKLEFKTGSNTKESELSPDVLAYLHSQTSQALDNTPVPLQGVEKKFSDWNKFKKKLAHLPKLIMKFDIVDPLKRNVKGLATYIGLTTNMVREYECLVQKPDYNAKYVYIPLHYQPERTTMPQGNVYMDQILMIRTVAQALPNGWKIYVKEHKSQLFFTGRGPSKFKGPDYYKRIAQIPNVTFVPISEDSFSLIKSAQAVATVTGTAAWEAVFRNVPALIFGAPWYQGCPGIFRVGSVEECRSFFDKLMNGYKISRQELIDFLYFLDQNTFHGYLQVSQHIQTKLTEDENKDAVLKVIIDELKLI